ncbi:MAG: ATP-dependent RecD-like DNA helicase [Salibacteraceae bacterium]
MASHYTLDEENSERLMLKYYEYLVKLKSFLYQNYNLDILQNLDKFPVNTDPGLRQYHERIAETLERHSAERKESIRNDRYYIHRIKPFFVNQKIYYEVTFTPTTENASKFDRVIAFTSLDISGFYAIKLSLIEDRIEILGRTMSILVITAWEVSIRPCEINNFSRIFGVRTNAAGNNAEYRMLMQYLTKTGLQLVEVIDFNDNAYMRLKQKISENVTQLTFFSVLDQCRSLSQNNSKGCNLIRYLLLRLNNKIIKRQLERSSENCNLSGLYLKNGCIPFDAMPFNTSLINHNPKISDLFECIQSEGRKHELFARFIRNNTEIRGHIYTPESDIEKFGEAGPLIKKYNETLWHGHTGRRIKESHKHLYISEYEENTLTALRQLRNLAVSGIQNYSNTVDYWLNSNVHLVDCDEKQKALKKMFVYSKVALIYGPAGTGKSFLINHVSHLYAQNSKIYLANTNPAIDNLKRKVNASNCFFSTIAKFLSNSNNHQVCDLLIIDECSTVNNRDIKDVLAKASFKLLVLVGDIYQIESIRFGNWFSAARSFIPQTSVFELTKPYRSDNDALLELWKRVRAHEDTIAEHIARNDYSCNLDVSIFEHTRKEEIILCLNYDGLYGINSINRFLQESNPNPAIPWGVHNYKVNDPILFNESNRFAPLIYNNMKGKILRLEILEDRNEIQFDIEIEKAISGMDAEGYNFTLLENSENGNSVMRFSVSRYKSTDDDDDESESDVVPFQVAYAVSIHKAQGLEYDSVKIVITEETDELISHNIFYTAITRARKTLKIYWSPEVQNKILERFKTKEKNKDVALLRLNDPTLASL